MGSDRARVSYDERQQYRSVVMQQGRVTLEADWNEAQVIAGEETRAEALDFVGPAGTPDNGYAVSFGAPGFDFNAGPGTMYTGGIRSSLPEAVQYSQQSDWLDTAIDPDWVPLPTQSPGNEYVYLLLREQEVSAVEDSDLKDVALGGPDTAQRTRLIQHIVRLATDGKDCPAGLASATARWAAEGLTFNPATMRLHSLASLLVGFTNNGGTPTPCDPTAQGGYLGADNQLIRVQIARAIPGRGPEPASGQLLWGYDDASFLYRVDVADPQTLKLQSAPVDASHWPNAGQAVEVLMACATLANGEFVAAPSGFVTTSAAYDPDKLTLSLQGALPAVYGDGNPDDPHPPQVFLRVWQEVLPFTASTPVPLDGTGLQVTLQTDNNSPFHAGDFWMFAVRPATPKQVYPERYLTQPQPAEGPREWVCPLAVIGWNPSGGGTLLADCRNQFDNLVDLARRKLGGCCTVNVSPSDLKGAVTLQTILDKFRGSAGANICLMPGVYNLAAPLQLTVDHSHFTIEACAGGAIFQAAKGSEAAFVKGMVIVNAAQQLKFRGIEFRLPLAPFAIVTGTAQAEVFVSIGLRPAGCTQFEVEDCQFDFPPAPQAAQVAVGILAAGECVGLKVDRNQFVIQNPIGAAPALFTFTSAFAMLPTTVSTSISLTDPVKPGTTASVVAAFLHDALFRDNLFDGLTVPVLVYADCGLVRFEANTVRNSTSGIAILSLPALAGVQNLASLTTASAAATTGAVLVDTILSTLAIAPVQLGTAVLRGFPLPEKFDLANAIALTVPKPTTTPVNTGILQSVFTRALDSVTPAPVKTDRKQKSAAAEAVVELAPGLQVEAVSLPNLNVTVLNQSYSTIEGLAFAKPIARGVPLALEFDENDISTLLARAQSGVALLVWNLGKDDRDSVTASGGTFTGARATGPVSLILGVSRCMHTGNMVLNEAIQANLNEPIQSLWLLPLQVTSTVTNKPASATAITGNVFRGRAILPLRDLIPEPPAPMDTWHFFNAET
jgi:hypothetical protein